MTKLFQVMIMYHNIQKFKKDGLSAVRIGQRLGIDRRTVKKYLAMSEEEFLKFKQKQARKKLLDSYEDFLRIRLDDCPEASSAQAHDWLKEHYPDFITVNEKTVFNFVLSVRDKFGIPKPFICRDHAQVEELNYGKQAQVDFGEYNMTTQCGCRKKVYFFSMVLSRSRQKYVVFRDRPFTTLSSIDAHEKCFQFFQGVPEQVVYDQDKLMLVNENSGDLILTDEFRKYIQHRGIKPHFCRKADPQSKGKIENVIKYVKYNFLRGRKYIDIDTLNGQVLEWLHRTANSKTHSTTKKIPVQEWAIEKECLKPFCDMFCSSPASYPYTVRKDNTIAYNGNFYALPIGTYKGEKTKVNVRITDNNMVIYDIGNNEIANHNIHSGKGRLVGGSNFRRDYSLKIDQLMDETAARFKESEQVKEHLQQIRLNNPRYIRDQLLLIRKLTTQYDMEVMNEALNLSMQNKILKASDIESLAKKLSAEANTAQTQKQLPIEIKTLNKAVFKIIPDKSDISDYKNLMN